jgi:Zn ribbon nucleic-acid-binding protein
MVPPFAGYICSYASVRPLVAIHGVEVPPETLPCPSCHRITTVRAVYEGIERVECMNCGKLLRNRPALSAEERAQARALRWAAAQIESSFTTRHRRKPRGGSDEMYEQGLAKAVDQLLAWARVIHKLQGL